MFNLLGLFRLASIGKRIGMDLWHYETSQGAGLQTALDYLLPYALKKQDWPYSQTASISTSRLVELLCQATIHFKNNEEYIQAYEPFKEVTTRTTSIANLVYLCG